MTAEEHGPPNSAADADTTQDAARKYLLLGLAGVAAFTLAQHGVQWGWWAWSAAGPGLALVAAASGWVLKVEEKRLKAYRFTRRSRTQTTAVAVVLILWIVIGWGWGSPLGRHVAELLHAQPMPDPAPLPSAAPPPADEQCTQAGPPPPSDWGPPRELAPIANSPVAGFNNATLDSGANDFRAQLVSGRDAAYNDSPPPNGGYSQQLRVREGATYRIRFFVFNNAPNRPDTTITGTRAFVKIPQCPATDVRLVGTISAPNAVPNTVWSTVHFLADKPFKLVPADRPAKICFSSMPCADGTGFADFAAMPDMYGEQGAPLGATGFDGIFPGATAVDLLFYVRPVFD